MCKTDDLPLKVYELAYHKHVEFVQQLEKGWFDQAEEDPEGQAAKEFRENREHYQMSQAWKDELTKSLSRCHLTEEDQPQEGDNVEVESKVESEEEQAAAKEKHQNQRLRTIIRSNEEVVQGSSRSCSSGRRSRGHWQDSCGKDG